MGDVRRNDANTCFNPDPSNGKNPVDVAAETAIKSIYPTTRRTGLEYCGYICIDNCSNCVFFTPPSPGKTNSCGPKNDCPKGSQRVGRYHTHPTGNQFSEKDKENARNQGIPSYVGLPNGSIEKYSPNFGSSPESGVRILCEKCN
jgi:hypothetical protein